jgi:hypothetical protein
MVGVPYYFGGIAALATALLCIIWRDNAIFLCGAALAAFLGLLMLLIGGIATLQGLTVRKSQPASQRATASPVPASSHTATAPQKSVEPVLPLIIRRLDNFVPGSDEAIIKEIDWKIFSANQEVGWEQLGLLPGKVDQARIPFNTRYVIGYLLEDHKLTHDTTIAHLFEKGNRKLRETVIRILGAMGTEQVLLMLEAFAAKDPLQVNEDDQYNAISGPSAPLSITWGWPLRELAREEIQKVKGLAAGS